MHFDRLRPASLGKTGLLRLAVALALSGGGMFVPAQAQIDGPAIPLSIPAQPLGAALNALAVQANLQLISDQSKLADRTSAPIDGTMTARQALDSLLTNTGLHYTVNADGTVMIKANAAPAAMAKPVAVSSPAPAPAAATPSVREETVREDVIDPLQLRVRGVDLIPANRSPALSFGSTANTVAGNGLRANNRWGGEFDGELYWASRWSAELALGTEHVQRWHVSTPNGAIAPTGDAGPFATVPDLLTLKYHLLDHSTVQPYLGLGVGMLNYVRLHLPFDMSARTYGALGDVGADIALGGGWSLNADAKWLMARPDLTYGGTHVGRISMDPWLLGVGIGYRFHHSESHTVSTPVAQAPPPPPPPPAPPAPPMDSDGDGVPDSLDKCPGTPAGVKVDQDGCEIEEIVLKGVTFATDSSVLTADSDTTLDAIVSALHQRPGAKADIRGYTDARGSARYNQALSQRRAQAVVDYLVAHGIAAERLTATGYGKEQPVADNRTEAGRAENRRVTIQFQRYVPR